MQNKRKLTLLFIFLVFLLIFIIYRKKGLLHEFVGPKVNLEELYEKDNIMPVVVLGSGPAGQSAGIYATRLGFKTLIIEGDTPGGQLTGTTYVENWPGQIRILGPNLMKSLEAQNTDLGTSFLKDKVTAVNLSKWPFELTTSDGFKINALSLIIATGSSPLTLKIPGEKEFWGKGVTTCAICDAPFFKDKNVIVVGGGDSAAEQVLQLAPHVKHINMLIRKDNLKASHAMQERIKEIKNLTLSYNKELKKIHGDKTVTQVDVLDNKTNTISNMKIDGVFLAIGHVPNSSLFKGQIDTDKAGYIKIKCPSQKTSIPGVFAAGDVEDYVYRQAGVASGSGIKSALDAGTYLHDIGFNDNVAQKIKNKFFEVAKAGPSVVKEITTVKELDELVKKSKIPVLLDFWAEYCPTCKHMLPTFESVAKNYVDQMVFVKVDTDKSKELVDKLFIVKVPSFIVYQDGQIIARHYDVMDKQQMTEFVEQFIEKK